MKKLVLFVAFAGLVGSTYAITPGGEDKKQEAKKACCKKEGSVKACSGEKNTEAKACSGEAKTEAKSCCKGKTEAKAVTPAATTTSSATENKAK